MINTLEIQIKGITPLIVHRWSDKAKKMMLDSQMKRGAKGKEAKDPDRDYRESLYYTSDGSYGFPALAFKAAAVRAGTYRDMRMTFLRGAFHIDTKWAVLDGEPRMREDMVRVGLEKADIRYRAEFPDWRTTLPVTYNSSALSAEQIIDLFNEAGFAVGVGEWRPEKDGSYGRFEVIQ